MAGYQAKLDEFEQNEISVYALSTDNLEHAKETVEKNNVTFPVMYGINRVATADTWGSYSEDARDILHATNFILTPSRKIAVACYSTGAVGRIEPQDALNVIAFMKKKMAEG